MKRLAGTQTLRWLLPLVSIVVLFLIANRGAYEGYFQSDDLDTLGWTWAEWWREYAAVLVSPRLSPYNFRPSGHIIYKVLEAAAGLDFRWWAAALQAIHLLNGLLLWLLLRSLRLHGASIVAALLFFLFHPATFDAYWRPMYVFDVVCGTFSLGTVLAYTKRRWVLSFVCFWLAFKAKELAVMLPAVLLVYEFTLGDRKWLRVAPFAAVSALMGLQAMFANRAASSDYTFRFTWEALRTTGHYYFYQVFRNVLIAAALIGAPFALRDRRLAWAIPAAFLMALPMLFLPGRMFSVYMYAPVAFVAVQGALLVDRWRRGRLALAAAMVLVWCPVTYGKLKDYRRGALTVAADNRTYVTTLAEFVRKSPGTSTFLLEGMPPGMYHWGPPGAISYLRRSHKNRIAAIDAPEAQELLRENDLAVLTWVGPERRLEILHRDPAQPFAPWIGISGHSPMWQFGKGWFPRENRFRWTEPEAEVRLYRPANAAVFEVTANLSPIQIERLGSVRLTVLAGGAVIGTHEFVKPGWQTVRWPVPPGAAEVVEVEFRSAPPFRPDNDPRTLGIALAGFGYKSR